MLPEELLGRVFREVSESRAENPSEDPIPSDNCYVVHNSLGVQVDCSYSKVVARQEWLIGLSWSVCRVRLE